jgi:hypothetical protein
LSQSHVGRLTLTRLIFGEVKTVQFKFVISASARGTEGTVELNHQRDGLALGKHRGRQAPGSPNNLCRRRTIYFMHTEKSTKLFLNCIVNFLKGDIWQFPVGKFAQVR